MLYKRKFRALRRGSGRFICCRPSAEARFCRLQFLSRPTLVHVATSAFQVNPILTVNTISPGIDPAEAASVTLFGPTETGITSINGNMVETIGLASNHPQHS